MSRHLTRAFVVLACGLAVALLGFTHDPNRPVCGGQVMRPNQVCDVMRRGIAKKLSYTDRVAEQRRTRQLYWAAGVAVWLAGAGYLVWAGRRTKGAEDESPGAPSQLPQDPDATARGTRPQGPLTRPAAGGLNQGSTGPAQRSAPQPLAPRPGYWPADGRGQAPVDRRVSSRPPQAPPHPEEHLGAAVAPYPHRLGNPFGGNAAPVPTGPGQPTPTPETTASWFHVSQPNPDHRGGPAYPGQRHHPGPGATGPRRAAGEAFPASNRPGTPGPAGPGQQPGRDPDWTQLSPGSSRLAPPRSAAPPPPAPQPRRLAP